MDWYLKVLKNYVGFEGRARRKEYWMYTLFTIIALVVAMVLDNMFGLASEGGIGPLYALYALATFLPGLAVSVRRLHDIGKSGWWILIGLIPLIGAIVLIVWAVTEGTRGSNAYGEDPKADEGGQPVLA
jgi:uncharacterized membrane protein YhaH (DUF805 family)